MVSTFPHQTSQAKKHTLGGTQLLHYIFIGVVLVAQPSSRTTFALTVYVLFLSSFRNNLSFSFFLTLLAFTKPIKFGTSSISKSLKRLTKLGFRAPSPLQWSQISATLAPFAMAKIYRVGESHRAGLPAPSILPKAYPAPIPLGKKRVQLGKGQPMASSWNFDEQPPSST